MAKPARMVVICIAAGLIALLPLDWWPAGHHLGLIGAALAIIILGTIATSIIRLRHAFVELLPHNHDDTQ